MLKSRTLMEVTFWARNLMSEHGLIEKGWKFKVNGRMSRTLGRCNYSKKLIEISKEHVEQHSYEIVLDTMLHEIAHALVGPGYSHGTTWQNMAIKIGAVPKASKSITFDGNIINKPITVYAIFLNNSDGTEKYLTTVSKRYYESCQSGKKDIKQMWLTGKKWTKGKLSIRPILSTELSGYKEAA